ncbi:MAG: RelA/SpoT family protein [Patescibacteria group bacterium]
MSNVQEIFDLIKEKIKKEEQELIKKAYFFAEYAHAGQKRANGDPYFEHAFETGKNLAKFGMDTKTIAAGIMHDVLEDTSVTETEMEKEFGKEIVFLVEGVTKLGALKYKGNIRHVESLRKFFVAISKDLRVVMIKFADRLHNLETLKFLPVEKQKRIALESIEVYAPLANRLGMGKLKGEIEDIAFPYVFSKECEEVEKIMNERKEPYTKYLEEIKEELVKELKRQKIKILEIDYRIKHKYSLYKKLLRHDMDIEKIYDIVALRVVVETVEECYRILGIIHSIWRPLIGRIKDYIAVPKPNGYRSIHTTIFTGSGGIAEIQIRTKEMHDESAYGIAAHFSYKEKADNKKIYSDKAKFEWIEELKNLKDLSDKPNKFLEHLKTDFFSNRIFVFTPTGDIVDLPEDSSPIDFAYLIHSDIGNHISGIKINGKMMPFSEKLKNGDIVEIITKKNANPSSKWLEYVKTSHAKKHIRSYLEKNSLLAKLKSFGRS